MGIPEKVSLDPFLDEDDSSSSSRDGSLDLPQLKNKPSGRRESRHETPSGQLEPKETIVLDQKPPPKRSATYAIAFMLAAQIFSASMNVSIRLLENASTHLHPLQVCLAIHRWAACRRDTDPLESEYRFSSSV